MSYNPSRKYQITSEFISPDALVGKTEAEIRNLFLEILQDGTHGFCFSLYEEGQKPGDVIAEEQIRKRMQILKSHTQWIRSFSCIEGNENIPKVAKDLGMKTLVGAWLGDDPEKNRQEIEALIDLCNQGYVDIAAVGNEVLYRNDLSLGELLHQIEEVKNRVEVPVGYVDAYYEFVNHPELRESSDVLLINCYPFWESCPFEYAFDQMRMMYEQIKQLSAGKEVIITETGWPSQGQSLDGAHPSKENAIQYFINAQLWTKAKDIGMFYFSSFDESWKTGPEGDVGAHWGIWDKNGKLKY